MIWLESHHPMPIGFEDLNQPITMDNAYPWTLPPEPPVPTEKVYPWPLPPEPPDRWAISSSEDLSRPLPDDTLISGFEDLGQPVGFEGLGFEDLADLICS